jgi:DNA primase
MDSSYKKNLDIQTIPIKEIISMYAKIPNDLRRNIRCILPNHRDKSASLRIYENNNSFYCF